MNVMRRQEQRSGPGAAVGSSQKAMGNHRVTRQKPKPEAEAEAVSNLQDEIALLLSRWNALQLAIRNQWGGRDSLQKSHQLAADIFSWFCQSNNAFLYVEDLETLLHESMLLSFNTEIEDGSIEEVAEQLMIMHEEFFQGHHY